VSKYRYIALFFTLFVYGFFILDEKPTADRLSNKLIAKFISRVEKKYSITASAIGGGGNSEGLRLLTVGFDHRGEPFTKAQARKLIIDLSQDFLNDINNDLDLKPHLVTFPFSSSNIDICVIFYNTEGRSIFDPYIDTVSASNDKISYCTISPDNEFQYKTKENEPYEEALAIVTREKDPSPRTES